MTISYGAYNNYNVTIYKDFAEFLEYEEELAKELLKKVGKGDWMYEELYHYDDRIEFAIYEVEDGWYSYNGIKSCNFHGAPDLFDYIDYNKLGNALVNTWDESCHKEMMDGSIITTSYGW